MEIDEQINLDKYVWLSSGGSKYLVDKSKLTDIVYFKNAMDERFGKKEYKDDKIVINIGDEFETIIDDIYILLDTNNMNRYASIENIVLLYNFVDYIQDDNIIKYLLTSIVKSNNFIFPIILNKLIRYSGIFPWIKFIDLLLTNYDWSEMQSDANIKFTLEKYIEIHK